MVVRVDYARLVCCCLLGICFSWLKALSVMAQTLPEDRLSHAAGRPVRAGEAVVVDMDLAMMHDGISPSVIKVLHGELGAERVWDPERIAVVDDKVEPAATIQTAEHQAGLRR